MKLSEVHDIIRSNMGKDTLEDHYLTWATDQALRQLEGMQDWYWMQTVKDWTEVASQQEYNITTSTSSGLNIPNFKSPRIMYTRETSSDAWVEVRGPMGLERMEQLFDPADTGLSRFYTIHETSTGAPTLKVWPVLPDDTYGMRWYYYTWTSLPTDVDTSTHEVLLRWPEALIALGTYQGVLGITKDPAFAASWKNEFMDLRSGTYKQMLRTNYERQTEQELVLRPRTGPYTSRLYRDYGDWYY